MTPTNPHDAEGADLLEGEVHITVDDAPGVVLQGFHITHVQLDARAQPTQTMLTGRVAAAGLAALIAAAEAHARSVRGVRRVKIEVAPGAVPSSSGRYDEVHFKLRVEAAREPTLRALASEHGAHLSRSPSAEGARFVTLRARPGCIRDAAARIEQALRASGFVVLRRLDEAVVYDSNLALDGGWGAWD